MKAAKINGEDKVAGSVIDKSSVYCYLSRILKNGEYFIYTDFGKSFIALLSSGTRLKIQGLVSNLENKDWTCNLPDMSDLNSNGVAADVTWKPLGKGYDFSVQEMQIITLGQDAVLSFDNKEILNPDYDPDDEDSEEYIIAGMTLSNTPIMLTADLQKYFKYKVDQFEDSYLRLSTIDLDNSSSVDTDNYSWYAFCSLQLICSSDSPQTLQKDQYVIFTLSGNTNYAAGAGNSIKTNIPVALTGGSNQSAELLLSDGTVSKSLCASIYKNPSDDIFWHKANSSDTSTNVESDSVSESYSNDTVSLSMQNKATTDVKHKFLYEACVSPTFCKSFLPVLIQSSITDSDAKITIKVKTGTETGTWSFIKEELSTSDAKDLKHSDNVIFLRLPDEIFSKKDPDYIYA